MKLPNYLTGIKVAKGRKTGGRPPSDKTSTDHSREYRERNPGIHKRWRASQLAANAAYRARKRNAVPKWLTRDQKKEILAFYKEAQRLTEETGIPHEVDHIHPLSGKNLSGLHVPWNLQVLTKVDNRLKYNKI